MLSTLMVVVVLCLSSFTTTKSKVNFKSKSLTQAKKNWIFWGKVTYDAGEGRILTITVNRDENTNDLILQSGIRINGNPAICLTDGNMSPGPISIYIQDLSVDYFSAEGNGTFTVPGGVYYYD